MKEKKPIYSQTMGVVFPVHMWGVPPPIIKFISEIKALSPQYIFAVAVDVGQVANTLVQLKNIFKKNGMNLSCGYEIKVHRIIFPGVGLNPEKNRNRSLIRLEDNYQVLYQVLKIRRQGQLIKAPSGREGCLHYSID
jgi:hypothetical protein